MSSTSLEWYLASAHVWIAATEVHSITTTRAVLDQKADATRRYSAIRGIASYGPDREYPQSTCSASVLALELDAARVCKYMLFRYLTLQRDTERT